MDSQFRELPFEEYLPGLEDFKEAEETNYIDSIASIEHLAGDLEYIPIYPNEVLTFGRENCTFDIPDPLRQVSKQHFRIYSVIYEKEKCEVPPLVYCEDLESTNGTYVNDVLIGQICRERIGYLLSDGDIIEIRPSWRFQFRQPNHNITYIEKSQRADIQHFRERFTVSDRILGSGQYGAVYLAKEVITLRQVACKIVDLNNAAKQLTEGSSLLNPGEAWRKGYARAATERERVKREIEILATLSHPHIINLKKAFCSDSTLYIFTDLAPGGDLFSYVEARGGFLIDWHSRVIAWQVVLAIDYMHSKGIVHRDIKPENILITQTDFGGRVVLTDFGFANFVNKTTGRLMSKLGTVGFVAPEVNFRENLAPGGYTKAADLWSFGVLTAFLLTGSQGVPPEGRFQLSQQDLVDRFCAQESQWSNVGPRALDFLRNILIIEPSHRMTSTEALHHSWFRKPLSEAAELEKGYKRIIRFWKERNRQDVAIENFPSKFIFAPPHPPEPSEIPAPRMRKKLPDATASPYFGLDRHLQNRVPSKRKELLASLHGSGSHFMISKESQITSPLANKSRHGERAARTVKSVDGGNIFGVSGLTMCIVETQDETQDDIDEVDIIPTTPLPHMEKLYGFNLSDPTQQMSSPTDTTARKLVYKAESCNRKRGRADSGLENSRRCGERVTKIHDRESAEGYEG